jgi:hypothetical protein
VEVQHQPPLGCRAEHDRVQVDDLLGLVVEEVDLRARRPRVSAQVEELAQRLWSAQLLGVPPQPDAYAALARIVDEVAQLRRRPPPPEPFDDVVLKSQLAGPPGEVPHFLDRPLAAVEVLPDRPPRFQPRRRHALREQLRVGRRRQALHGGAIHQRVQVRPDHDDAPRRDEFPTH